MKRLDVKLIIADFLFLEQLLEVDASFFHQSLNFQDLLSELYASGQPDQLIISLERFFLQFDEVIVFDHFQAIVLEGRTGNQFFDHEVDFIGKDSLLGLAVLGWSRSQLWAQTSDFYAADFVIHD